MIPIFPLSMTLVFDDTSLVMRFVYSLMDVTFNIWICFRIILTLKTLLFVFRNSYQLENYFQSCRSSHNFHHPIEGKNYSIHEL
mmetsp:Transcript_31033/g.65902  ORF Transcript_31033/g.65902 Transcript_31033/m.65902 type:complete len:84 (-) Transcript_31033:61-312(-)